MVVRGGFGRFYSQIPDIYASQVAIDNGMCNTELYLDIMKPADAAIFPKYPNVLVNCPSGGTTCIPPASVGPSDVAGVNICGELPHTIYGAAERDLRVNLPKPKITEYPVYNDQSVFTGDYYSVASFATWQTTRSVDCPYPPCLNDVQRPDPPLGRINSFESAATSIYNGSTVLLKGQIAKQMYIRAGYTLAKAVDDGTDSLVVGRPGNVQNTYAVQLERGLSVTDQRNRFIASAVYEPLSFHYELPLVNALFNNWKVSSVITVSSGRPINATIAATPTATTTPTTIGFRASHATHTSDPGTSQPICE